MKIYIFILIAAMAMSCNPCKRLTKRCGLPAASDSTTITTSESTSVSSTWTEADSSYYFFALECDSAYNVILKKFQELNTGLRANVQVKEVIRYREDRSRIQGLEISLTALVDSLEVQNRTIEKLRSERRVIKEPYPVEVVKFKTRPLFIYGSIGFLVLVLMGLTVLWLKFKTKILGLVK